METLLPFVLVFDQSLVVCSLVKNCKGFSIPLMCLSSYLITPAHVSYVFIYSNACFYKHIYTTREDSCAPHTTCLHNMLIQHAHTTCSHNMLTQHAHTTCSHNMLTQQQFSSVGRQLYEDSATVDPCSSDGDRTLQMNNMAI